MDLQDQARAWKFVNGFDVPFLDDAKRHEWQLLITNLSVQQFKRAVTASRERPINQLHLRPSIEAFRSYATAGTSRDRLERETATTDKIHRLNAERATGFDAKGFCDELRAKLNLRSEIKASTPDSGVNNAESS